MFSPLVVRGDALDEPLVVVDLSLQLQLDAQQVLVDVKLPLHLQPHLPQLRLQVQYHLVEGGLVLLVLTFGVEEALLQIPGLKKRGKGRGGGFEEQIQVVLKAPD